MILHYTCESDIELHSMLEHATAHCSNFVKVHIQITAWEEITQTSSQKITYLSPSIIINSLHMTNFHNHKKSMLVQYHPSTYTVTYHIHCREISISPPLGCDSPNMNCNGMQFKHRRFLSQFYCDLSFNQTSYPHLELSLLPLQIKYLYTIPMRPTCETYSEFAGSVTNLHATK